MANEAAGQPPLDEGQKTPPPDAPPLAEQPRRENRKQAVGRLHAQHTSLLKKEKQLELLVATYITDF